MDPRLVTYYRLLESLLNYLRPLKGPPSVILLYKFFIPKFIALMDWEEKEVEKRK
jgi:hypothetical protein